MDWITEGIALTGARERPDAADLAAAGIEAVLILCDPGSAPHEYVAGAAVLALEVADGEPLSPALLRQGIDFVKEQRDLGRGVLVTCGAGVSRSPTFVAAYLHEQGMDLLDALVTILHRRPRALPHPELIRSLVGYYQLPTSAERVLVELVRERKRLRSR